MEWAGYAMMMALLFLAMWVGASIRRSMEERSRQAVRRLARYAKQARPYQIYVGELQTRLSPAMDSITGTRAQPGGRWYPVEAVESDGVQLESGDFCPYDAIGAFLVAYPGGQVLDCHEPLWPLPDGVFIPEAAEEPEVDFLVPGDFDGGNRLVRVQFALERAPDHAHPFYTARLFNESDQAIRVYQFALYTRDGEGGYYLDTHTGRFHSEVEFQEWYGVEAPGWLEPGQMAMDPNCYGEPEQLWAYYFETESGDEFIAGYTLPASGP